MDINSKVDDKSFENIFEEDNEIDEDSYNQYSFGDSDYEDSMSDYEVREFLYDDYEEGFLPNYNYVLQRCSNMRTLNDMLKYLIQRRWLSDGWNYVSKNKNLTLEFMKEHQDKLNWDLVSNWASKSVIDKFRK